MQTTDSTVFSKIMYLQIPENMSSESQSVKEYQPTIIIISQGLYELSPPQSRLVSLKFTLETPKGTVGRSGLW